VHIKITPYLRETFNITKETFEVELKGQVTVHDFLKQIGIKKPEYVLVVINGKALPKTTPIKDGDCIEVLPVFEGG
jgi:sulfur carrier protein ThiS